MENKNVPGLMESENHLPPPFKIRAKLLFPLLV